MLCIIHGQIEFCLVSTRYQHFQITRRIWEQEYPNMGKGWGF